MVNLFTRFVQWSSKPVKEKDLGKVMFLNTRGVGGEINVLPSLNYDTLLDKGVGYYSGEITYSLISTLKNWHVNNWEWDGFEDESFTAEWIEYVLFVWGKVSIVMIGGKRYACSFIPLEWDNNWNTTKIKIIVPWNKGNPLNGKIFNVDDNCVLIFNDDSWLLGSEVFYGTLWRVWPYLKAVVESWRIIKRNQTLSKKWIKVPYDTAGDRVKDIERTVQNDNLVLPLKNDLLTPTTSSQGNSKNDDKLEFADQTAEVWENYYNHYNELKSVIGMHNNTNNKKKERQIQSEITVDNELAVAQLSIALREREKASEKMNRVWKMNVSVKLNKRDDEHQNDENEEVDDNNETD